MQFHHKQTSLLFHITFKIYLLCRYFQNVGSPTWYPDHVSLTSENEQFVHHKLSRYSIRVFGNETSIHPHELLLKWDLYGQFVGFHFVYTGTVTTVRTLQGENRARRLRNFFIHKSIQAALGQGIAESSQNSTKMADMNGKYRYLYFSQYCNINLLPKTPKVTNQWNRL